MKDRIGIEAIYFLNAKKTRQEAEAVKLIQSVLSLGDLHDYYIFCQFGTDTQLLEKFKNAHVVKLIWLPNFLWSNLLLPIYLHFYKIKLLHCTSILPPFRLRIPVVVTYHAKRIPYFLRNKWFFKPYQKLKYKIKSLFLKKADQVIAPNKYYKKKLQRKYQLEAEDIQIIYSSSGVDSTWSVEEFTFSKFKSFFPKAYLLHQSDFNNILCLENTLLGYAAYFNLEKDPFPLVILNQNKSLVFDTLKKLKLNFIKQHLFLLENVYNSESERIFRQALLFIYPCKKGDNVLPLIDSISVGTPVISYQEKSIKEVLGKSGVLLHSKNAAEMAEALVAILHDTKLYDDLVDKSLERSEKFNQHAVALKMVMTYAKSLKKGIQVEDLQVN